MPKYRYDRQKSGGESLAASLLFSLGDSKAPLLLLAIEDVTERNRAEETLRTHAEEISRLARGMVGRELRIIEMKKEVNELCHRLSEVGRYPLEFEQGGKERPDS